MTDHNALIRTVLSNPEDDAPRLIYADWLEEHGRVEDAEFIRVQIELARRGFGGPLRENEEGDFRYPRDMEPLITRQTQLWLGGFGLPDLPDGLINLAMPYGSPQSENLLVRRGFVERAMVSSTRFFKVAAPLFAQQPVTQVCLWGLQPSSIRSGFGWVHDFGGGRYDQIPDELWGFVYGDDIADRIFPTAEAALAALSQACVRYGRAQAGLE